MGSETHVPITPVLWMRGGITRAEVMAVSQTDFLLRRQVRSAARECSAFPDGRLIERSGPAGAAGGGRAQPYLPGCELPAPGRAVQWAAASPSASFVALGHW